MCRIRVKLYSMAKDHLLSRARTDRARRDIHVESLNNSINDFFKKDAQDRAVQHVQIDESR